MVVKLDMRHYITIRVIVNNIFHKKMSQSAVSWYIKMCYVRKRSMQKYYFNSDQRVLIPYFRSTPTRYNLGIQTLMM